MRITCSLRSLANLCLVATLAAPCAADAPFQRSQRSRPDGRVYKTQLTPHWFDGDARFWYRNELRGERSEFVLVDAERAERRPAFDHARLAKALIDAGVDDASADRLPIRDLELDTAGQAIEFRAGGTDWRCRLDTYELQKIEQRQRSENDGLAPLTGDDIPRRSTRNGPETSLTFVNRTSGEIELFWLDGSGERRSYGRLAAGAEREQHTYAGHVWEVVDTDGRTLAVYQAEEAAGTAEITGRETPRPRRRGSDPDERDRRRRPRDTSPDGRWTAFIREHNLFIRPAEGHEDRGNEGDRNETGGNNAEDEIQLSTDGGPENAYGLPQWSPDSRTLVAFRTEPGDEKDVYLIESSPRDGGRARLHTRPYALPGDKYPIHELNLFDVAGRKQIKPDVDPIDFGRPRLRWHESGRRFTYEKVDRGHQRFRLIEIDARTGSPRTLIDEQTETFIWTAHAESRGVPLVTWLDQTDEIIYASERDGWRHLYLIDAETGSLKNQITRGEWVVRGIDHIDEEHRQVWFRASGREPDQDPYFIHHYRINFDGTGLVALTAGNGNHRVRFSPDRRFLIDTYSRVDMAPIHELRRTSDGELLCRLEQADVSELEESGWTPPEPFVATGRDGQTGIWGIVCRPRDFDPDRKYPVIEHIYAGPHGAFVPKSFSPSRRFSSLTDLGFVVVQIDGMGTAHRSKAFHDVCWHNLKDAGLPDRILWHRAVAEKYPWYDIDRVGIYGGSAGGQNATAAVLFHPEFYKAAVSGCGCHDNRLDKASWNEQWMGYPVGPQYAECSNNENAHRLRGWLLLIVGEMDINVPPESTLRLADALIEAGKDFEMLVVPGAGHGMGGAYGQRRLEDFFVRHLHGREPPNRNAGEDRSESVVAGSPDPATRMTEGLPEPGATSGGRPAVAGVERSGDRSTTTDRSTTATVAPEEPAATAYDLVLRNGRIIDGTGNPWFEGDVAVRADRIVAVGRVPNAAAQREIDCRGLAVAPGFIDIHSHSDYLLLEDGRAQSKIRQGVTTEILGEGSSAGPFQGRLPPRPVTVGGQTRRWATLGEYFDVVESAGVAVNVASYVGIGNVWQCVMGDSFDRPTPAQLDQMRSLVDEAMRDGALGLSSQVMMPPGSLATTDDLVALCEVVRQHGGIYSTHIRNEGTGVFESVKEAIAIGERAGVPVDVIHLKIADQQFWGRMSEVLALFEAARRRGVNVQANVYPYTRGNNNLVSIVPPWAHEGGRDRLLARLKDPEDRERIKRDIQGGLPGWYNHYTAVGGDWSRMLISADNTFKGLTMDRVMAIRTANRPDADRLDELLDFLIENDGSVSTVYAHHTDEDMTLALQQPWCSIGSDGSAYAIEGKLRRGNPHPRNFGTFPRVLGVYVRELGLLRLEDAVRKMTSLNAAKVGLTDRGLLRPGQFADITVFDPERVIDRSTYTEPFQYSEGIEYVVVNGDVVLERGEHTGALPGRALRHRAE